MEHWINILNRFLKNDYTMKTIINSKLREWLLILSLKEWNSIKDLVEIKMIYINPTSKRALIHIVQDQKKLKKLILSDKRGDEFNCDNYIKISKHKITAKDWINIKSEIPKACSFYQKIKLMNSNPILSDLELQQFFLKNSMLKNLDSQHKINKKNIDESKIDHYYQGVLKSRNIELHISDVRQKDNRKNLFNLNDYQEAIELFYYENFLHLLCEKRVRNLTQKTYEFTAQELNLYQNIPDRIRKYPQIKLYSSAYYMFVNESDNTFYELKNILFDEEIKKVFQKDYLNDLINYLIPYCIIKINKGNKTFIKEYLECIDLIEKSGLLLEQGILPIWRMKNAIKIALKIKDYDWARTFLKEQQDHLLKENRQAIVDYCEALIAYTAHDYKTAYDALNINPLSKDPMIKIESLLLYVFILLELKEEGNDYEELYYRSKKNLRGIFNSKAKDKSNIEINENFIHKWRLTLKQIGKIETTNILSKSEIKIIQEDIISSDFFPGKNWLIDYVERKS
jgi:hypothetical protein